MKKSILLIYMGNRKDTAPKVQAILTGWGCIIKTRLGIHDGVLENCSDNGLVFCELVGDVEQHKALADRLKLVKGISVKLVELAIEESENVSL